MTDVDCTVSTGQMNLHEQQQVLYIVVSTHDILLQCSAVCALNQFLFYLNHFFFQSLLTYHKWQCMQFENSKGADFCLIASFGENALPIV